MPAKTDLALLEIEIRSMRRKGERKLEREWMLWGPSHPVARAIATGTNWLDAWTGQACSPWSVVTKRTGISTDRLYRLADGDPVTRDEVEQLASVWGCPVADVLAALPVGTLSES